MIVRRVLRPAQVVVTAAVSLAAAVSMSPLASPAPTATATQAPETYTLVAATASPSLSTGTYEKRVQYWINQVRAKHGHRALSFAACTDRAAERWSSYLAANDEFYHQSMTKLLNRCDAYYAGETLGRGSIGPRKLVSMWMHSPPHREVLMSTKARRIGIGATPNSHGEWVVAANFMQF